KELDTREERPVSLEPSERPCKRQKIWEVCTEIIEESGGSVTSEKPELELYLSEPLIELEVDTCRWWGDTKRNPSLSTIARVGVSQQIAVEEETGPLQTPAPKLQIKDFIYVLNTLECEPEQGESILQFSLDQNSNGTIRGSR
uniref:Uncharacterized protein n=1 Tax=Amphimedon queenslandica TaxID=400682 RepID=A0A1X7SF13_AMPQE